LLHDLTDLMRTVNRHAMFHALVAIDPVLFCHGLFLLAQGPDRLIAAMGQRGPVNTAVDPIGDQHGQPEHFQAHDHGLRTGRDLDMVLAIDLPLGLDVGLVRELVQALKREIPV
jgi:hypothetical protein